MLCFCIVSVGKTMTSSRNYNYSSFSYCNFGDNSSYSTTNSANPSPCNELQSVPVGQSSDDQSSNVTSTFDYVPLHVAHVSKVGNTSQNSAK